MSKYLNNKLTVVPFLAIALVSSAGAVDLLVEDFSANDGGFVQEATGASPIPATYNSGSGTWSIEGDDSGPATNTITSPAITVPSTSGIQVSFDHRYSIEGGDWDGCGLQISIDGGEFKNVPASDFSQNGYTNNGPLIGNHVLTGLDGFSMESVGYGAGTFITSVASVGGFAVGSTIQVRFVGAFDEGARGAGIPNWEIDSVKVETLSDTDGDGIPDSYEDANGLDKTVNDAEGDLDSDDLSNIDEYVAGSDPQDDDSDDDGLKDGAETNTGIYVSATDTGTNPLSEDTDSDGLLDLVETNTGIFVDADDPGTNPNLADTDNDGFDDGSEIASSTDPNDDTSVPAGWAVRNATSSVGLNSIADTRNLFATPANILDETNTAETNINFRDNAAGPFPNARAFPVLGTQDVLADDYGILATGTIFIGDPGIYTFGFNSDDGGGLFIDGEVATIADVNRGSTTSLGAISLSYGNHVMEFVYWERGGGAQVQLFAAKEKGDKTGEPFDVAKYKLLETSFAELVDSDNDGLDDGFEIKFFGDLSQGPDDDSDIDGLTNLAEAESGLDPSDDDTDDDGLKDGVEDGTGTFVSATQTGTDPSNSDSDGDGLADGVEDGGGSFVSATQTGSDPNKADTDGDSVKDGAEVAKGRDPTVPQALPSGYLQDFDGFADGTTELGDGSVMNGTAAVEGGQLVLTRDGVAGGFASFMIPPLKGSENGWTASFDLTITDSAGANEPADGFSFNYGNFELTELGNAEEGMGATGGVTENISFEVDTWMNLDAEQGVNIAEKVDGTEIDLSFTNGSILADGTSVSGPVTIVYDPEEGLSFTTEGLLTNADFENIATTFLGDTGYNFGFSARVGGANQTLAIDNLQISLGGAPQDNFRIISIENVIVPGGRGNPDTRSVTVTWNSSDRKIYQVFASSDLSAGDDEWDELDDSVSGAAGAETTSYTESGIPAGTVRRFYQIREVAN